MLADEVGFEPTNELPRYRISSAGRYDHFDTHPQIIYSVFLTRHYRFGPCVPLCPTSRFPREARLSAWATDNSQDCPFNASRHFDTHPQIIHSVFFLQDTIVSARACRYVRLRGFRGKPACPLGLRTIHRIVRLTRRATSILIHKLYIQFSSYKTLSFRPVRAVMSDFANEVSADDLLFYNIFTDLARIFVLFPDFGCRVAIKSKTCKPLFAP